MVLVRTDFRLFPSRSATGVDWSLPLRSDLALVRTSVRFDSTVKDMSLSNVVLHTTAIAVDILPHGVRRDTVTK